MLVANLVHQQSTSTGTGNFTLASVNGKQTFDTAFSHGSTEDVFPYFISNQAAAEYEWGTGHMSDASTLVRDTVLGGSNGTSPVDFSAGTKDLTNDIFASKRVTLDGAETLTNKTISLADNTVNYTPSWTDAVARSVAGKLGEVISLDDFGAVGDGTTDDKDAIAAFFAAVSGKVGLVPGRSFYASVKITAPDLSNCVIFGIPGKSEFIGDDRGTIELSDIDNVEINGITFNSTRVDDTIDNDYRGPLYAINRKIKDLTLERCGFTCPDSKAQGLFIAGRSATTETYGFIDGLWVEDCDFFDIGSLATTIMNRNVDTDQYDTCKHVYVNRNRSVNTGINTSAGGFFISFDGSGSNFSCDYNYVSGAKTRGIENTGWISGSISYNTFTDFSKGYIPLSNSNADGRKNEKCSWVGNRTLEPASNPCVFYDCEDCVIRDNFIEVDGSATVDGDSGSAALLVRDSNNCKFSGNTWRNLNTTSAGHYAALISNTSDEGATCAHNTWDNDTFDFATVGSGFACVSFSGATTQYNLLRNCSLSQAAAGTRVNQASSATKNLIQNIQRSGNFLNSENGASKNLTTDANYTTTILEYSGDYLNITDTGTVLTATRTITLENVEKLWCVKNGTAQSLSFKGATGTSITVAAGKSALIFWDGTNMVRVTADA